MKIGRSRWSEVGLSCSALGRLQIASRPGRKRYFKASNYQAGFGRLKLRICERKPLPSSVRVTCFEINFELGEIHRDATCRVIDWGLQHIERLRKADSDAREEKVRRWTTIVIPALSLLIALLSIGATTYMQYETLQTQSVNSIYQVTIQPKQANYASLMSSLFSAFEAAIAPDPARMYTYIDEVEKSIYAVEPFLDERHREELWEEFQSFQSFCAALVQSEAGQHSADKNAADQDFVAFRSTFRQLLYRSLFER
jgi:hypothetical protein